MKKTGGEVQIQLVCRGQASPRAVREGTLLLDMGNILVNLNSYCLLENNLPCSPQVLT